MRRELPLAGRERAGGLDSLGFRCVRWAVASASNLRALPHSSLNPIEKSLASMIFRSTYGVDFFQPNVSSHVLVSCVSQMHGSFSATFRCGTLSPIFKDRYPDET